MAGKAKKKTDIEINALIQAEKERLNQIYINLPEKKYKTALKLIDNVAFMSVTLDKLMEEITNSDFVVKTKNASLHTIFSLSFILIIELSNLEPLAVIKMSLSWTRFLSIVLS